MTTKQLIRHLPLSTLPANVRDELQRLFPGVTVVNGQWPPSVRTWMESELLPYEQASLRYIVGQLHPRTPYKVPAVGEVDKFPETNPWMPGSENLTLQGNILTNDPEMAAILQAEAGVRFGIPGGSISR